MQIKGPFNVIYANKKSEQFLTLAKRYDKAVECQPTIP